MLQPACERPYVMGRPSHRHGHEELGTKGLCSRVTNQNMSDGGRLPSRRRAGDLRARGAVHVAAGQRMPLPGGRVRPAGRYGGAHQPTRHARQCRGKTRPSGHNMRGSCLGVGIRWQLQAPPFALLKTNGAAGLLASSRPHLRCTHVLFSALAQPSWLACTSEQLGALLPLLPPSQPCPRILLLPTPTPQGPSSDAPLLAELPLAQAPLRLDEVMANGASGTIPPVVPGSGEDPLVLLIYTSGSTGRSNGP